MNIFIFIFEKSSKTIGFYVIFSSEDPRGPSKGSRGPPRHPPKIKQIIKEIYDLILWNIICSQLPKSSFRSGRVKKINDIPCGPWSPFRAPRRAPKVKMSVSLGTCDKNWNTWKNMEILIFNYVYKTNEILNILKSASPQQFSTPYPFPPDLPFLF